MTKLQAIYEPTGRAKEYADLALNLFNGCDHTCAYCYAPKLLHIKPGEFHSAVTPRKDILTKIEHDAKKLEGDKREILLCFTCDAYSKGAMQHNTTTGALRVLLEHGLNVNILTKGGSRSLHDFELLKQYKDQVTMGSSLVFNDDEDSLKYEPNAAVTSDRCRALYQYHCAGFKTWVSFEPVWSAHDVCELIEETWTYIDHYKIGKLNYHPHAKDVSWPETIRQIIIQCKINEVDYMLKKDTARYLHEARNTKI